MKPLFIEIPKIIFGLRQTILADKFWGIWGIFERFISTHCGTVSPLSMFFINQSVFLPKTKPLYPNPKCLLGIGILICTAKNEVFSHRMSVVRAIKEANSQKVFLTTRPLKLL